MRALIVSYACMYIARTCGFIGALLAQGGDPPEKAAKLVLDIIDSEVSGGFLWIDEPAFYTNPDVTHPSWTIPKL